MREGGSGEREKDLAARLYSAAARGRLALFFDYDGTLTPIVSRPEDARLSRAMRRLLSRLAARLPVAVVSGRDLADVRRLVALPELVYAGSHGFEIAGPDGLGETAPQAETFLPALASAAAALERRLAGLEGVEVERKRFAIAVHFRRAAPELETEVARAVAEVAKADPRLVVTEGKKVLELRPALAWDKGRAVLRLLAVLGLEGEGWLPVYVGDDVTDEDAFRALSGRGLGLGVLVEGERDAAGTAAALRLPDVAALERLLAKLLASLESGEARASPSGGL